MDTLRYVEVNFYELFDNLIPNLILINIFLGGGLNKTIMSDIVSPKLDRKRKKLPA